MGLEGYDKLATFLSRHPEFQYFRRFSFLNTKIILYLQSQLAHRERELHTLVAEDKAYEKKAKYPFSVWDLQSSADDSSVDSFQWDKVKEVQELLSQYNVALLQQSHMLEFQAPAKVEMAGLRKWLRHPKGGGDFFKHVTEMDVWEEANEDDMLAIYRQQDEVDTFTKWICTDFLDWFDKNLAGHAEENYDAEMGARTYDYHAIRSYTYVTTILISGLLPASSIIVLYFLKQTAAKLMVAFVYNLVFSWVLGFLVKARRAEIFGAATAFAAVQVALVANTGECAPG